MDDSHNPLLNQVRATFVEVVTKIVKVFETSNSNLRQTKCRIMTKDLGNFGWKQIDSSQTELKVKINATSFELNQRWISHVLFAELKSVYFCKIGHNFSK